MKTLLLLLFFPLFSYGQNSKLTATQYSVFKDGRWSDIKDVTTDLYIVGDSVINYEGFHLKINSVEVLKGGITQINCVENGRTCEVRCGYKCGKKYVTFVWQEPTVVIHLTGIRH